MEPGMLLFVVIVLLVLAVFGAMIWAVIDIAKAEFPENMKLVWILVVLLGGLLGLIIYLALGRAQKLEPGSARRMSGNSEDPFG